MYWESEALQPGSAISLTYTFYQEKGGKHCRTMHKAGTYSLQKTYDVWLFKRLIAAKVLHKVFMCRGWIVSITDHSENTDWKNCYIFNIVNRKWWWLWGGFNTFARHYPIHHTFVFYKNTHKSFQLDHTHKYFDQNTNIFWLSAKCVLRTFEDQFVEIKLSFHVVWFTTFLNFKESSEDWHVLIEARNTMHSQTWGGPWWVIIS